VVQHFVGLGLAFVELLEAEAERLKLNVRQTLLTGALVLMGALVAAGMLTTASGLLLWAAFLGLRGSVGQAPAALILGAGIYVLVGGASWLVANRLRRS
jgi:hypothetical protein